jgi:hypothetical protein
MRILEYHLERETLTAADREEGAHGGEEVEGGEDGGDELDWHSQVVDSDEANQVPGLECVSQFHH